MNPLAQTQHVLDKLVCVKYTTPAPGWTGARPR